MEKILIIGAGDFQLPLVQKAAETYEVLVAAPVVEEAFLPYISKKLLCDVRDKETILDFARQENICGVITDQTDIAVRSVAYVAEQLGLPGIGYQAGCLFTNKALMRKKLEELGIPTLPNRTVHSLEEAVEYYSVLGGSVIIKPPDTQGSRGVQLVRNSDELREKYAEAARWSTDRSVMIERLATGPEFVVEGMSVGYDFRNLCCGDTMYFDIPDAFAARSRIFPSDADPVLYQRILDRNTEIIKGFGLKQGISHSEYIMDGDEIYLLETAARGGGVFISSDLIHLASGLDTEAYLLEIATGKREQFPDLTDKPKYVCGYMAFYVPVGTVTAIEGLETVKSLPYIHRNQLDKLKIGMVNNEGAVDKTSRFAMIVSADSRRQLEERMAYIRSVLNVKVRTTKGEAGLIWQ